MYRLMFLLLSVLLPVTTAAQSAALSGDWQVTQHFFGATRYMTLHVDQSGDDVKGTFGGTTFECQLRSGICEGSLRDATNPPKGTIRLTVRGNEIQAEGSDEDGPFDFVARRRPA